MGVRLRGAARMMERLLLLLTRIKHSTGIRGIGISGSS